MKRTVTLAVLVVVAAVALVLALRGGRHDTPPPDSGAGGGGIRAELQPAPDFEIVLYQGERVLGAGTLRLSELWRQRPVVLNFWAGLCPPCRVEMPDFQKLHDGAKGRFTVIGVDIGPFTRLGTRQEGKALLQELGVTFPAGTTNDADTVAAYKILGMPTTVFITPRGMIVRKYAGLLTLDLMETFTAELVRGAGAR